MATLGMEIAAALFLVGIVSNLIRVSPKAPIVARLAVLLGVVVGFISDMLGLPNGTSTLHLFVLENQPLVWRMDPAALVILAPAWLAVVIAVWVRREPGSWWSFGVALALLGVLCLTGLNNGASMIFGWELMSLGGAVMILSNRADGKGSRATLSMLALLEVGSVALIAAVALLGPHLGFASFRSDWAARGVVVSAIIGLLFLVGFGAKLGVVPLYSWVADAYGSADGPTGAVLSSVVLNAAYFALGRALLLWLPVHAGSTLFLGVVVAGAGMLSAIVAILYAFQQRDWRRLLSLSGVENAGIAIAALGAALIFQAGGQSELAGLCWLIGILHLMGHSLAKASLFIASHVKAERDDNYQVEQTGVAHEFPWTVGVGGLIASMSLSAMPPAMGFVTEWLLFEALFHDFTLTSLAGRTTLILVGAGLALSAALSLATFVKLYGVGLLGARRDGKAVGLANRLGVIILGLANLAAAISLVFWEPMMRRASWPDPASAKALVDGLLIVPLSSGFAFISPVKFVIVGALFAILPILLVVRRFKPRRVPPWSGGEVVDMAASATTAFAFSNPLRTVYSFLYRPKTETERSYRDKGYVLEQLSYHAAEAPMVGAGLIELLRSGVSRLARLFSPLQSGQLNAYLSYLLVLFLIAVIAIFIH
ncbi:proton-conducting transporter membrane subunit [Ferrimicrobium acidiphilum]|uniref:proton-conducting transporter transmembrane domain-containing protein n=1 Tax=Ferrimicrobium acidiphilum TaxID=121039 RepID=UPI0023F2C830|nr:proton-conducting transporter membrane subunit [Ferrimicrobium acidiphilum]